MRKAWVEKKKKANGTGNFYQVRWYAEDGRQKSRNLPTKPLAEEFKLQLEHQLNFEDRVDPVEVPWETLRQAFLDYKEHTQKKKENYLLALRQALDTFHQICGPVQSTRFSHKVVSEFVTARNRLELSPATMNTHLKHLRVFIRWAVAEKYMAKPDIRWAELLQTEDREPPIILNEDQLGKLLQAAMERYGHPWYLRILLAVSTGPRAQDIQKLKVSDIDVPGGSLRGLNRKSSRMKQRPVHPLAMEALKKYLDSLPPEQEQLFPDPFDPRKWNRIKEAAKMSEGLTFHNLRACFLSYILLAGFSTSVAQDMVDHKSSWLTHHTYSNLNPAYRAAANAIPLGQAILKSGVATEDPCVADVRDWAVDELVRKLSQLEPLAGAGLLRYSYATASIHIASMIVRRVSGMELEEYLRKHLAEPIGWGRWGYGYKYAKEVTHTPGGGGITLRATDMLRFGYLLLREGRWGDRQLVPAEYVRHCRSQSPYNPHYPYSLQFDINTGGHYPEYPRDAFWKSGSGAHMLYVVPSLDLVVWKLAGRDSQYEQRDTGVPLDPEITKGSEARRDWKPSIDEREGQRLVLSKVIEAITPGGL